MTARRNVVLLVLVVGLLLASVVGAWFCWRADQERALAAERQDRYGDVLAAGVALGTAVVNLRYDDPETLAAARNGATGELRNEYDETGEVGSQVVRDRSVLDGTVTWAGVSDLSGDEATVLVATTGTVTSRNTDGEPSDRRLRLRIRLVHVDDRWLAEDVELVG